MVSSRLAIVVLLSGLICLSQPFLAGTSSIAASRPSLPVVTDVRAGDHREFQRLVVELTEEVDFDVKARDGKVYIQLRNVDTEKLPKRLPSMRMFSVIGTRVMSDRLGTLTNIIVSFKQAFRMVESVKPDPYRIILDFYPVGSKARDKAAGASGNRAPRKAGSAGPVKKADNFSEPDTNARGGAAYKDIPLRFNEGWRGVYREKAIEVLWSEAPDSTGRMLQALSDHMGLRGEDVEEVLAELDAFVEYYESQEEHGKAALLEAVAGFLSGKGDPEAVDGLLRVHGDTDYSGLVRFLQGSFYEGMGFYPEAVAYYEMAAGQGGRPDTLSQQVAAEALFRIGLIHFRQMRAAKAAEYFRKAMARGRRGAGVWLANALLAGGPKKAGRIKGLYAGKTPVDPITTMSMADMSILEGDIRQARLYFERLSLKYSDDPVLGPFFRVRAADTYLAEGRRDDAVLRYNAVKKNFDGEGRAMAELAVADVISSLDDKGGLVDAARLYRGVAEAGYLGSEQAYLGAASTLLRLKKYGQVVALVEEMLSAYPTSNLRDEAYGLKGMAAYGWIRELSRRKDREAAAKVFIALKDYIPYDRRSETYLAVGRAFLSLGLYSEAVNALSGVVQIGRAEFVGEAMVLLGKAYLGQGDLDSAQKIVSYYISDFSLGPYMEEARGVLARILFKKGDYRAVVGMKLDGDDPRMLKLRAASLYNLGRYKKAESTYRRLAKVLSGRKDPDGLASAYTGIADSLFMSGRYKTGLKYYKMAYEISGEENLGDRLWAAYRMAEANYRLGRREETAKAIMKLKAVSEEVGNWGEVLFAGKDGQDL